MFHHGWNQKWVATQIKKLNEKCLLTYCYCHSLNLAVRDTIKYSIAERHLIWLIKSLN